MNLSLDDIKTTFKHQLITLLLYIAFIIISCPIFQISFIGITDTGEDANSGFLSSSIYKMDTMFCILSCLLFIIAYALFSTYFLKMHFLTIWKTHIIFKILYIVIFGVFIFFELLCLTLVSMSYTGLGGDIQGFTNILYVVLIFPIVYSIIDFTMGIRQDKKSD